MDYYVHLSEDTLDKLEKAIDGTKIDVSELEVTQNGTYIAPTGKAYSPVEVNVPNPSTGKVNITSTAEVNVTQYATAQVVDANLIAENIKKDISILGVSGSYEGGGSSDFSTAQVTIDVGVGLTAPIPINAIFENTTIGVLGGLAESGINTLTVPLYKGSCVWFVSGSTDSLTITVSGDIVFSNRRFTITGDGSITIRGN